MNFVVCRSSLGYGYRSVCEKTLDVGLRTGHRHQAPLSRQSAGGGGRDERDAGMFGKALSSALPEGGSTQFGLSRSRSDHCRSPAGDHDEGFAGGRDPPNPPL